MGAYNGRNCTVRLGASSLLGIGDWNMEGVSIDQIDTTSFGSTWKTFEAGMSDGGQITFSGYFDPTDTEGQVTLRTANENGTQMPCGSTSGIRFYYSAGSYFTPCTSNPVSYILVTNYSIKAEKSDVCRISFTTKVSGKMSQVV
jgi:hypothetical protein